jgi:hypothetical protein
MSETNAVELPAGVVSNRPDIVTVTPETFNSYVDEKLGIDPEKQAAAELAAIEEKQAAEKAKEEDITEDLGDHVPKDKKGKLNERFSELTEARKTAEAAAAAAKAEAEAIKAAKEETERILNEMRAKYEPPKTEESIGPEPDPSQFNDIDEFRLALKDWTKEKTILDQAKENAERQQKEAQEASVKNWHEKQSLVKTDFPDYEEVISNSSLMIPNEIQQAILDSDIGPKIAYHLAKNPEIMTAIYGDNPQGATIPQLRKGLLEIGKLEAKLGGTVETETKSAPKVAEISKAPAPITPLKGNNAPVGKVDTSAPFMGTYDQYKKMRQAGKIT